MLFNPADPKRVTMYVCGPTVYDAPHLGNARPAVVFDVLFRVLRDLYGEDAVIYASNYTDIDDKIIERARKLDVEIGDLTDATITGYRGWMDDLGVLPPTLTPRATETIPQMIDMIERLIAKGHAYDVEGHVFFSVATHADHGCLSGQRPDENLEGVRTIKSLDLKRDPADFVMWKPSDITQPGWESPWGRGRPGWHIECSAMIADVLGETIDIHGGGNDLIFPHHEAEIAQSQCLTDKPLARYWVHNGMVTIDGRKMSKSADNFVALPDILGNHHGEVLRYLLLNGHYSQPIDFTWAKLAESKSAMDRLYRAMEDMKDVVPTKDLGVVQLHLAMNLNTPEALAKLHMLASEAMKGSTNRGRLKAELIAGGALLGLLQEDPDVWFGRKGSTEFEMQVSDLIERRTTARTNKDWSAADEIRKEAETLGIVLEDGADGTTWRKA